MNNLETDPCIDKHAAREECTTKEQRRTNGVGGRSDIRGDPSELELYLTPHSGIIPGGLESYVPVSIA